MRCDRLLINAHMDCLEPNDCFENALYVGEVESRNKAVFLVLGMLDDEPHAWLEINGAETDPTAAFFQATDDEYLLKIKIPIAEANSIGATIISQMWNVGLDPRDHKNHEWNTS